MTNKIKTLRKLLEAEMDQAESVIAARGFSQELQDMIQSLGRLLNEDLPAVAEQMRNSLGPDVATAFEDQTTGVLQGVLDSLRDGKQSIDNSVSEIAAGGTPTGSDPSLGDDELDDLDLEMGDEDELDLDLDDPMADDEPEAEEPELDLEDPLGRPARESVETLKKKIAEARRMVNKARKIKEGRRGGFAHSYAADAARGFEHDSWDQDKRDFKRRELEHELADEEPGPRSRDYRTWYLKVDGNYLKTRGQVKTFSSKKGANNYALAMMRNRPSLEGKLFLTTTPPPAE